MSSDDEALFERFRARGDAQALGELFDRAAPALLRLAVHLVRDPADAEDLLQATFLQAIEARDTWDRARPVMPWLCGILHNQARTTRRRSERAPDPQRLPRPAADDPARAAEASEFDAAVDAAIALLPPIYQPVLRLHLAYGHAPAEIAHALDRPAATVRSQLARGLELLRQSLPHGLVGSVGLWLSAGRGLAAVKQTVLAHAAVAVPVVATTGGLVLGAAAMKKTMLTFALAVVAAGAWLAWPRPEPTLTPVKVADVAASAGGATLPREKPATTATVEPGTDRVAANATAAPTTGSLRIACRWGDDGTPAWGVLLNVSPLAVVNGDLLERAVATGSDGTVLVADLPAGKTRLAADRGGESSADVVAGHVMDADLVIPAGVNVRGRVVDEHGAPVPAARVWLSTGKRNYTDGQHVAGVDSDGRFFLRSVEAERFLSAHAPGLRAATPCPVRGANGATIDQELVLRGKGTSLLGRVLDPDGTPVAGARVLVGFRDRDLWWATLPEFRPPLALVTDARGEFRADGLVGGTKTSLWARAPGFATFYQDVALEPDEDTQVVARLQVGATVEGRITDATGKPLGGTFVSARGKAWPSPTSDYSSVAGPDWIWSQARPDADGFYRLAAITPGTVLLRAGNDELKLDAEFTAADGEKLTWNAVLTECALEGRVVDERGDPIAECQVNGWPPRGKASFVGGTTDTNGRFRFARCSPVGYRLDVYPRRGNADVCFRPLATLRAVRPGETEIVIRVPDAAIPSAAIEGTLLDADGRPAAKAQVRCTCAGSYSTDSVKADPESGRFRIAPLPAGSYRLQGTIDARRGTWSEPVAVAAREVRNVGEMQMSRCGTICASVRRADGKPLPAGDVILVESYGWGEAPWGAGKIVNGQVRVANVPPGPARLRVQGPDLPCVQQDVAVVAEQETRVAIIVPEATRCRLVLSSITEPVPMHLLFAWTRDGVAWQHYDNFWEGDGELTWSQRMLPGSYEVTITSETGKQEVNRFVVAASDPPDRAIPIKLP